jgi:Arc/MetJ-type ribon-helix-helix transcriptional regulator
MKRTTVYLDPDIEVLLKLEALRRKEPMSEVIREALRSHLGKRLAKAPPGAGAFDSGHADTAERAEDLLARTGFGQKS